MAVNMTPEYYFGFTWQNWKLSMQNYPEFVENVIRSLLFMNKAKRLELIAIYVSLKKNVLFASFPCLTQRNCWAGVDRYTGGRECL